MFKKIISITILAALLICSFSNVVFATYIPSILGDIDEDGAISTTDYLKIKSFFLGQNELYEKEFLKADIDGNRIINTTDYLYIKKIFLDGSDKKAVNLYIPDEQSYNLVPVTSYFDGSIENLISELIKVKAIPENTKVYSFSIENKTAYIDLSKEFGTALEKSVTEEELVLGSLVNTITRCYGVDNVIFTIEGKVLTTDYICYDFPLCFNSIVKFYVPNEDYIYFETLEGNFDGTVNGLIERISDFGNFPKEVKVYSFSILNKTAYIDLSEEFGKALETGTLDEAIIIGSLVNTIIKHYNVKKVQFTVEGKIFDSGHSRYDLPLCFSEKIY